MFQPKDKDKLMDTKTRPLYMLSTRNSPQIQGHVQNESERLENTFHGNRDKKKAGVAILIPDKTYFVIKIVIRDKERHYIMIKGSIKEEDIAIINIYAPNIGVPQRIRQMLANMKREINSTQLYQVTLILH